MRTLKRGCSSKMKLVAVFLFLFAAYVKCETKGEEAKRTLLVTWSDRSICDTAALSVGDSKKVRLPNYPTVNFLENVVEQGGGGGGRRLAASSISSVTTLPRVCTTIVEFETAEEAENALPLLSGSSSVKAASGDEIVSLHDPIKDGEDGGRDENRRLGEEGHPLSQFGFGNLLDIFSDPSVQDWHIAADSNEFQAKMEKGDKLYRLQWGLENTPAGTNAQNAWRDTSTGEPGNVVVAIVDTGLDLNHPDLARRIWRNPEEVVNGKDDDGNGFVDDVFGWDFVSNSRMPVDDSFHAHGTHVGATVGALPNNRLGIKGVHWNVSLMPLKFLGADGRGYLSGAVSALEYSIAMKADISNHSWGASTGIPTLLTALKAAETAGQLIVTSAGNSNIDIDEIDKYPGAYTTELSNMIVVASHDSKGNKSYFSNFGKANTDVSAPGTSILAATTRSGCSSARPSCVSGRWRYLSGTSMAAPHVSGIAAILISEYPCLRSNVAELKDLIVSTADGSLPEYVKHGRVKLDRVLAEAARRNTCASVTAGIPDCCVKHISWRKGSFGKLKVVRDVGTPAECQQKCFDSDATFDVTGRCVSWTHRVKGSKRQCLLFSNGARGVEISFERSPWNAVSGTAVTRTLICRNVVNCPDFASL